MIGVLRQAKLKDKKNWGSKRARICGEKLPLVLRPKIDCWKLMLEFREIKDFLSKFQYPNLEPSSFELKQ